MSIKVEFLEKSADDLMSILNAPSAGHLPQGDLVVFEEDVEDLVGDDGMAFVEDLVNEDGPKDDMTEINPQEWSEEWAEDAKSLIDDLEDESVAYIEELSEELEGQGMQIAVSEDGDDVAVIPIPGSNESFSEPEQKNDANDADWENDRNPAMFMPYLESAYPSGIPSHDGNSMVGCEVALLYLNKLNKEISEALRSDSGSSLDPLVLEDYRVKILKDMVLLKERMNGLKKDISDATRDIARASSENSISKTATTPRVQIVATPFERAIAGILINSVVSAGHPFEDVYDYLNKKYAFSERDELSIMQLVMDSGHHIFKDRGAIGSKFDADSLDGAGNISMHGVDFIKNYFA